MHLFISVTIWFQVITSFVAVGIIFIPIGIASLFASEQVFSRLPHPRKFDTMQLLFINLFLDF